MMLSWISGQKAEDAMDVDDTRIEPPETPAPVFAVRAFKHAIFGTPQPPPTVAPTKLTKKRKELDKLDAISNPSNQANSDDESPHMSPTKAGILLTPGTVRGKKKEVTFGAHVCDNENKKPSRSGIPSDCPGKFPSPWTPKVADRADDCRNKTKLTEVLFEAKTTGTMPKRQKLRSKDDADITIDIMEPRSESGRHWKEMYMTYRDKSEEQIAKLNAKYKLCKDHARRKDEEATELRRQLESNSKKHQAREKELDKQIKDLREKLRLQMAENAKTSMEIALLRKQIGQSPLEASTSKLKKALEKFDTPTADCIWIEESTKDKSRERTKQDIQAAVMKAHDDQAQSTRAGRERRLARKTGSISRQDSVFTPSGNVEFEDSDLELSPTPKSSRDISKPLRRILGDMSPNVAATPPIPSFFSESAPEKIMAKVSSPLSKREKVKPRERSPTHREAMAEAAAALSKPLNCNNDFDDLAPMSALSLQAEQPVTPFSTSQSQYVRTNDTSIPTSRHKRSGATSGALRTPTGLDETRAKAAKARVEARKAKRHARLR